MSAADLPRLRQAVARRIETIPAEILPEIADFLDRLQASHRKDATAAPVSDRPTTDGKLERELASFRAMHDQLLSAYYGEFVAVHEGQIVDHDPDLRSLYLRVYATPGRRQVLMKRVTDEPEREILLRPSAAHGAESGQLSAGSFGVLG